MKKPWIILLGGIAIAIAAYLACYFICTAPSRALAREPDPELAWLKKEFHLNDAEFQRVSEMHSAYLSGCAERCRKIDEKNEELKQVLGTTHAVTPEVERLLLEAARLRAECQKQMLQHFFEVSRTMPADQGQRYLAWVQQRTILPDSHEEMHHSHH